MKKQVKYKGFEINISRENSLGGDLYWYYHIINPDGVFIVDSFTRGVYEVRKNRILYVGG